MSHNSRTREAWRRLERILPGFRAPADGKVRGIVVTAEPTAQRIADVLDCTPQTDDGYSTPVYIVNPDLSPARIPDDIDRLITDDPVPNRVRVFGGQNCVNDFEQAVRSQLTCSLPRDLLGSPSDPFTREVIDAVERVSQIQSERLHALKEQLDRSGPPRMPTKSSDPLRVLIITSRYTSYVKHAAMDLAESFHTNGHSAQVLQELNAWSTINALAYLERIETYHPHVLLSINFPRSLLGHAIPKNWPFVCWAQDAMQHVFSDSTQRASETDLWAGHVYHAALERAGYSADQILERPVCVSEKKFNSGNHPSESCKPASRFTADIAYVSHRSETPEQAADRLAHVTNIPLVILQETLRQVEGVCAAWNEPRNEYLLEQVTHGLANRLGSQHNSAQVDQLRTQVVLPLAEQVLRHTTLEWAAEIANTHGLRLRIYGRGWDTHPTLNAFAAGPIAHGSSLSSCYASARIHLHASPLGCTHQRVAECALSGGVPICLRSMDELYRQDVYTVLRFLRTQYTPDVSIISTGAPGYLVSEHADLMKLALSRHALPEPPRGWPYWHPSGICGDWYNKENSKPYEPPLLPEQCDPYAVLGAWEECTFGSQVDLEQIILRAIAHPDWRDSLSRGMRARAVRMVSMDAFANDLIQFTRNAIARNSETTVISSPQIQGSAA